MKVFALILLLISICYVKGSVVKRQAEEEPQAEVSNRFTAQFTELMQTLQQQTDGLASSLDKFGQTTVDDIRSQFETAFRQLQDRVSPLTEQIKQHMAQLFNLPVQAQQPAEEGA